MQPDRDPSWRKRAACRRVDPETMYPTEKSQAAIGKAKAICATCPVEHLCRSYALTIRDPWGIWGGLTAIERHRHTNGQPVRTCDNCGRSYVDRKRARCPHCRQTSRINANITDHRNDIHTWATAGWTDAQIAAALGCSKEGVRAARHRWGIPTSYQGRLPRIAPTSRQFRPCGTPAAKRRHARRQDPPCAVCRWAGTPQPAASAA